MINDYYSWLNESSDDLHQKAIIKAAEIVAFYCLESLSPTGGNNNIENDWLKKSPLFTDPQGPDMWINCGDFDGKIDAQLRILQNELKQFKYQKTPVVKEIETIFGNYGLVIDQITVDETIVHLKELSALNTPLFINKVNTAVNFYENIRPKAIKELKEKYKTFVISNKFGL